jgi:hypothetical protein
MPPTQGFGGVGACGPVGVISTVSRLPLDFGAHSPSRAPRGCPLSQCWDLKNRPAVAEVIPTL